MRVLITGITGFAGRHLASLCHARGDEVHGMVRPGRVGGPDFASLHPVILTNPSSVGMALEAVSPDVVFHLAGASSVGQSFAAPLETYDANLSGTLGLLEGIRLARSKARCLVVTSGEIYGRVPLEDLPVEPTTPLCPLSPYGASKAAADLAAGQYRSGYGLEVLRVRAFNQIGPGQDTRFILPNVARQIARAERRGAKSVDVKVGNVDTRRDFTDVRDMVRAYVLLAERGDPDEVYLACGGRSVAVREIVEGVAELSRVPVEVSSDATLRRDGEQPDLYGSAARLHADTGWAPAISLQTTLTDTLEWWRARVAEED